MTKPRLKLGVNIDHVATLRQARGTTYPDPRDAAALCISSGAEGITVHLREDRRHIQDADVYHLRKKISVPLNLEMANVPEIVNIALDVHPDEVCLVPEKRQEVTTEGGLDAAGQRDALAGPVKTLRDAGISVSLFIEADPVQLEAAAALGVPYIELHTGSYCDAPEETQSAELEKLITGARTAHQLGLKVNAGHGINMQTINGILRIPYLDVLNIGHSIVARAVLIGMENAVREMRKAMDAYRGGEI